MTHVTVLELVATISGSRTHHMGPEHVSTLCLAGITACVCLAGKSSGPRRGRSAGGAQAARIEYLEKSLFSNTRRSRCVRVLSASPLVIFPRCLCVTVFEPGCVCCTLSRMYIYAAETTLVTNKCAQS